jgi:rhamnogalacturonan endolyase
MFGVIALLSLEMHGGGGDLPAVNGGAPASSRHQLTRADSAEQLLFSDDFTKGAAQWIAEFEDSAGSSMSIHHGVLEVKASAGATIWFRNRLSGNIVITCTVMLVDSGGPTDRVSDLNAFWMASDPARETPFNRNGRFASYDDLDLYYAGVGGHDNTTTRFRRYRHGTDKSILQEYADKQHLLKGNTVYSVKILVRDGRTSYSINGVQYFEYAETAPLMEGYFAFRTTKSHQRISNFKIEQHSR